MNTLRFQRKRILRCAVVALVLLCASSLHAQGCSQCRDNVAGSAPHVQRAFRKGILILAVPAVLLLGAFVVGAYRARTNDEAAGS